METLTNRRGLPSDPPAANRPRWVMLNRNVNDEDADPAVADAMTTAASCTSLGQRFSISFALAAPPATTRFYCDWSGGGTPAADGNDHYSSSSSDDDDDDDDDEDLPGVSARNSQYFKYLRIIAAHDNSVLINMNVPYPDSIRGGNPYWVSLDNFLYETGGGARPPTLSLLPDCYISTQFKRERDALHVPTRWDRPRCLVMENTAVLRAGDGDGDQLALVAQLEVIYGDPPHDVAELCVLRPGREWELKRLHIEHHDGGVLPQWPQLDAAVAVGRRFICWVDYVTGFFVCDMAAESSSKLRYVPLPVAPPERRRHDGGGRLNLSYLRNLAGAGEDAVRFVSVAPGCCGGGPGESECERSRFAFNVTTWTLTLRMEEPMTWVKDGVLDCHELWHQPNYGSLPRVAPRYPIVSCDNPDIVCFTVVGKNHDDMSYDDDDSVEEMEWMIQIDTRSKELMSAVHADTELALYSIGTPLPANLRWQQPTS